MDPDNDNIQEHLPNRATEEDAPAGDGHAANSNGESEADASGPGSLVREGEPQPQEQAHSAETPSAGRVQRHRRWLWAAAAVFLALVIYAIYHFRSIAENNATAHARAQAAPAAITVGKSFSGNMNVYVDALGTVTPQYTVTVYSQVTGQVIAVHYQQGQIVNKGDPLIDIDPRPYQATLAQAQGTLAHDQGVLAQAVMDMNRYQAALNLNAIARQQYEDQVQLVAQSQGTVKADQATVAYDQVQLSYCHIVSPITGRVGLRLVDPGNTVFAGSGSTLVVITQLQPITVVFNVSEDDLPQVETQLRAGHTLAVGAFDRSFDKKIESGTLTSLDNEVDTTTGTVKFRAEFPNRNFVLYPNQFVNAQLLVKTLHGVTIVPSGAVQHNGTTAFVYVVKPPGASTTPQPPAKPTAHNSSIGTAPPPFTVAVQDVTVLTANDEDAAIQGLSPGVTVATTGFDRLENGVPVTFGASPEVNNPGHGSNQSPGGQIGPNQPAPGGAVGPTVP